MQTLPDPASAAEAMDQILSRLSYLAAADPTALAVQVQAECLQAFEQADAISTAARAQILGAFTAGQGYSADADYSPTSWLISDVGPSYIANELDLARWAMVSLSRMPASGMASTVTLIPVALVNGARWDDW